MGEDTVLVELRFDSNTRDGFDTAVASLGALDVQVCDTARDPTIVAALTVVAAATTLTIELIKLVKELSNYPKTGCNPQKIQDLRAFSDSYLERRARIKTLF